MKEKLVQDARHVADEDDHQERESLAGHRTGLQRLVDGNRPRGPEAHQHRYLEYAHRYSMDARAGSKAAAAILPVVSMFVV